MDGRRGPSYKKLTIRVRGTVSDRLIEWKYGGREITLTIVGFRREGLVTPRAVTSYPILFLK